MPKEICNFFLQKLQIYEETFIYTSYSETNCQIVDRSFSVRGRKKKKNSWPALLELLCEVFSSHL